MGGAVRGDQAAHAGGRRPAGRLSVRRAVLRRVRARAAARARVVALLLAVLVAVAAAFCAPGGSPGARAAQPAPDAPPSRPTGAQRLDVGRFTAVAYPRDLPLARALLAAAARTDTFPGLPRPRARVLVGVAPDARTFRAWGGAGAPEWGAALAFPHRRLIVMQGRAAPSDAGDPRAVLRHELAHLALHEALGDLPPRWFDEGYASYAAGEFGRDDVLAANLALLTRGVPHLADLDAYFASAPARRRRGTRSPTARSPTSPRSTASAACRSSSTTGGRRRASTSRCGRRTASRPTGSRTSGAAAPGGATACSRSRRTCRSSASPRSW
jgi:hypothetical protein